MAKGNALRFSSVDVMPAAMQAQVRKQLGAQPLRPEAPKPVPAKRSKYGAVKSVVDGIRFDSKREARRYEQLKRDKAAGKVKNFWRQVPFDLPGGIVYLLDFLVHLETGELVYEDAKGVETKEFKLKRRLVKERYGVEISTV